MRGPGPCSFKFLQSEDANIVIHVHEVLEVEPAGGRHLGVRDNVGCFLWLNVGGAAPTGRRSPKHRVTLGRTPGLGASAPKEIALIGPLLPPHRRCSSIHL